MTADQLFSVGIKYAKGNVVIIQLKGDLDLTATGPFEALLEDLVSQGNANIVADCRDLNYLSSRGAGEIFGALAATRDVGGDLKFYALGERARTVFDLLGLTVLIEEVDDLDGVDAAFVTSIAETLKGRIQSGQADPKLEAYINKIGKGKSRTHSSFPLTIDLGAGILHRKDCPESRDIDKTNSLKLSSKRPIEILDTKSCPKCKP